MIYLFLIALFFILIMLLLGIIFINTFDLKKYGIQFATPVGMVAFFAILQIVYYPVQILEGPSSFIHYLTLFVSVLVVVMAIIKKNEIVQFFKESKQNKKSILCGVLLFVLFCFLYSKIEFMLRTEDSNFYINYVSNNVYISNIGVNTQIIYKYQGIYNFYTTLVYLYHRICFLPGYIELMPLGIVSWIPSFIFFWVFSFFILDLFSILNHIVIRNKSRIKQLLYFGVVLFTLSHCWYLTNPYYGNTFRRITIVYLMIAIYSYYQNQNWKNSIWISIILFSLISQTSTGFFLSAMLIYALIVLFSFEKRNQVLLQFGLIALPLAIYLVLYVPKTLYLMLFIYVILLLATWLNWDEKLENIIHVLGKVSCGILPCLFAIIPSLNLYTINESYTSIFREHSFDGVYGYLQFNQGILFSIFNIFCWIALFSFLLIVIKKIHQFHYFGATMAIILLTFFNPFVCQFVSDKITGLVYFRIYDLIFNPFTLTLYFIVSLDFFSKNRLVKIVSIGISILLVIIGFEYGKTYLFKFFNNEINIYYHTTDEEIEVLQTLREKMYIDDPSRKIIVGSHIYGTELLANYPIKNVVDNRVDDIEALYLKIDDESVFQQIFYRKLYDDPRYVTDYMRACQLARDRNVEYTIVESQYNYQMEDGLGYCGEILFEQNGYRVYIMRYDWLDMDK